MRNWVSIYRVDAGQVNGSLVEMMYCCSYGLAECGELENSLRCQREDQRSVDWANAILLPNDGKCDHEVAECLALEVGAISYRKKGYQRKGLAFLVISDCKCRHFSHSVIQEAALYAWLGARSCSCSAKIETHVLAEVDLSFSHLRCVKFVAVLRIEYRNGRILPKVAIADPQDNSAALCEYLMTELRADKVVYFVSSKAYSEYQRKPAIGVVKTGSKLAVKTNSRRSQLNIHWALNLEKSDRLFVESATSNRVSAAQRLIGVSGYNPKGHSVTVIWDNATCQNGQDVAAFNTRPEFRIHLIQLSPYCSYLSSIEQLWAVNRLYMAYTRLYPTRRQFADTILASFTEPMPSAWKRFLGGELSNSFRGISHRKFGACRSWSDFNR